MSADDSDLFQMLFATPPYRRGRYLLRLAAIGAQCEKGQISLGMNSMQVPAPSTAHLPNPKGFAQQKQEVADAPADGLAVNPIDLDLSDLWASSMLKV